MHEAFADRICGGFDRAIREQPFGPGMVVWTIDGHMFAAYTEAGEGLSLRVDGGDNIQVQSVGESAVSAPLFEAGWVLVPWQTQPEILRRRIAASYNMVLADKNESFGAT